MTGLIVGCVAIAAWAILTGILPPADFRPPTEEEAERLGFETRWRRPTRRNHDHDG